VRFLIERDGMAKFRALYAMTPLVSAWLAMLPKNNAIGSEQGG